jgi:hypothetical protein
MAGMVIAILVFIVFLLDLVIPGELAPFDNASRLIDVIFVICAAALGVLSWMTYREQD